MKILIDLQGAQTSGSRHRGIGRYSLSFAEGILRNRGEHDVHLLLNGAFRDSIEEIRNRLGTLIDGSRIHIFEPLAPTRQSDRDNVHRRICSEMIREGFISRLSPDIVHVTSHFEGFGDEAITSFGRLDTSVLTSVSLYDLIPYIHSGTYLENTQVRSWYEERILQLRRADLLLSISASSGQEAVDYLGFREDQVVDVRTAADPQFVKTKISDSRAAKLRSKYGIRDRFVMYTGGIDYRKNIDRLIVAFAKIDPSIRKNVTLAVVCSCKDAEREHLYEVARSVGLTGADLVMTGFVTDAEMVELYTLCDHFVFPSWHEGFGLPALEAMWCGAAVIGSNCSSLPEVIGRADALFDPFDESAIAQKMAQVLTDRKYRDELKRHSLAQSKKFSWDATAKQALKAFEDAHARRRDVKPAKPVSKPKLAYVSPLPPARSGIADYSSELLPELARHYDIDVVIPQDGEFRDEIDTGFSSNFPVKSPQELLANRDRYDRVLYHFGNSDHHGHMVELIRHVPGVVVLHDFYLSGLFAVMEHAYGIKNMFSQALFDSHGYGALVDQKRLTLEQVMWKYPSNRPVLDRALGVIVHSPYSIRLAKQWYGAGAAEDWTVIPHMRKAEVRVDRAGNRKALGVKDDEFLICSFGGIGETKFTDRLVEAFAASKAAKSRKTRLVLVGGMPKTEFGDQLASKIEAVAREASVEVTGYVSREDYRRYLAAADMAVQLRTLSRGETSGAVLDCFNFGIPTIVNANGSMGDLPRDSVVMLDDDFTTTDLVSAIDRLHAKPADRKRLSSAARETIRVKHDVRTCADAYADAIEDYYRRKSSNALAVSNAVADACGNKLSQDDLQSAALLIEAYFGGALPRPAFVDATPLGGAKEDGNKLAQAVRDCEKSDGPCTVIAFEDEVARTRHEAAFRSLDLGAAFLPDHMVHIRFDDRVRRLSDLSAGNAKDADKRVKA